MLLERTEWFDRRTARCLVAWWIGSIITLACVMFQLLIPMDMQPDLLSVRALEIVAFMSGAWMVPGFVLGGWKVLLVAVGRSAVRTGTDRGLFIVFAAWAIGWPLFVVAIGLLHGG
jgi:hypothetical protein